jgi:DNA polymerase-3 subunit alpha
VSFVHLHVHSEFSLGRSLVRMNDLVKVVSGMGMNSVALTDWGNLYGSLYFLKAAQKYNLKPIFGVELGVRRRDNLLRHVVLLAQNNEGYKNLERLVTRAHVEFGFEKDELKPQIPFEVLKDSCDGMICMTAGMKGIVNSFLLQDQEGEAKDVITDLNEIFKDRFYLELQETGISQASDANEWIIGEARRRGIPLVATADCHYVKSEDAFAQEVWMMVGRGFTLNHNPRTSLASGEFYIKSPEEMRMAFASVPEALDNTLRIAEQCNVKLSFKDKEGKRIYYLPAFEPKKASPTTKAKTQDEFFAEECAEGLAKRLAELKIVDPEQVKIYQDRIDYEVRVIIEMGFAGYYLIVSDFIRWAKAQGIPVGPGRGSGAGSLAAYVLDIVDIDPIENRLVFERFLNPERVSLPDFDIDFCQQRRFEVIQYVSEKYGRDHVCQIVTFLKEQSKAALKDVGRVMGFAFGETNRLTKLIPVVQGKPFTIDEAMEQVREFKDLIDSDPRTKQLVELARTIEGGLRQPGVHAAGVIIASKAVADLAPMSVDLQGNPITQWDMKMSEEAGLVKFDFLGLVTLDLLDLACKWIRETQKNEITYDKIPINDPRAYELIGAGDTLGVFQLESSGMQNLCVRMKPDRFDDIAAINALFRPGPLESGMVDDFIARKHGKIAFETQFPEMKEVLSDTYGVIVYQEQVMELARVISGYTLGGADLLRRAMGKKIHAEMEAQRENFVTGAEGLGRDPAKASELFDLIAKFAGYGFNKSHASAYAKISVQSAQLKAAYPVEFFTALLTIEKENTDKLARYIQDAKRRGLLILPPDVNESVGDFACIDSKTIRFGLSAIRNVGDAATEVIIEARKKGPFKDLWDFISRVDTRRINKRVVESLIQAGAFDSMVSAGQSARGLRGFYLGNSESAIKWAASKSEDQSAGQFSLFGDATGKSELPRPPTQASIEVDEKQSLKWEKDLLGVYLSGHPLDKHAAKLERLQVIPLHRLEDMPAKTKVLVAGVVSDFRELRIKRGRRAGEFMAAFKLEDATSHVEIVSFPDHYKEYSALFKSDSPLLMRAELDFEEDKPRLLCGEIALQGELAVQSLEDMREEWPRKIELELSLDKIVNVIGHDRLFVEIANVLSKHRGPVPVELLMLKGGRFQTRMSVGSDYHVQPSPQLLSELQNIVSIPDFLKIKKEY